MRCSLRSWLHSWLHGCLRGFFALCLALSPTLGQAQDTYVVGVEDLDYYPHYRAKGGDYQGFARDVLDLFATQQGIRFDYKPLPISRLYPAFLEGQVDFKYPDNPNWQQDAKAGKSISYSASVVQAIDGVMVLPSKVGATADSLKSLGTVRGFTAWDYLDRIKAGSLKVQEVTAFDASLQQGINGRVDGVYMNVDVARYLLRENIQQPDALVFDAGLPHTQGSYQLASLKHAALIEQFNAFLAAQAEQINALKAKYQLQ